MNFEKYENKKKYPSYSGGVVCECGRKHSPKSNDKLCSNCGFRILDRITQKALEITQQRDEYNIEEKRLKELFMHDLYKEHGVSSGETVTISVGRLFSKAWEDGHSCGFMCVADEFNDLISLVSK